MLVPVFVVFTIALCGANTFECYNYGKSSETLEINCYRHKSQSPRNCSRELSNQALNVTQLKIEGCDQRTIGDASAKYPNIETLNISRSGYRSLSWMGKNFEKLTTLDASANDLTKIPASILSKFPHLKELRLDGNKIDKISAEDFQNANRKLGTISLSNNQLNSVDDAALITFEKISSLNLTSNSFKEWPMAVFKQNIQTIYLQNNPKLTTIDCALFTSTGMNNIYFTWEYIQTFNGSCDNWYFLIENHDAEEYIHIYADHTTFYCNVSKESSFENMRHFVAGPRFGEMIKMLNLLGPSTQKIDISGIPIGQKVDDKLFERFEHLSELSLRNIGLTTFCFNVLSHQTALSRLDISHNNLLTRLDCPERLQNFTQLAHFSASSCQIRNLDEIVKYLPTSVRHLMLNGNQFAKYDVRSFGRLENLEELDLHDNNIYSITDGKSEDIDFAHLPSTLKRLNLHRTNLKQFKNLDREHFPVLDDLDVTDNQNVDCEYSDELRSKFQDVHSFRADSCKKSGKFWIIFLAVLAISIILFIVILEKVRNHF